MGLLRQTPCGKVAMTPNRYLPLGEKHDSLALLFFVDITIYLIFIHARNYLF